MGRHLHYRPGSFYRVDDRTGFPQRAERTRKEWTGLIVDESVWESRQPQDLVRGVKDNQNVPDARPLAPAVFLGPTSTTLSDEAAIGATVLPVQSTAGFQNGDSIGVMLASGSYFNTTLAGAPGASTLTLATPLPYFAPSGNIVTNFTTHIPELPQ